MDLTWEIGSMRARWQETRATDRCGAVPLLCGAFQPYLLASRCVLGRRAKTKESLMPMKGKSREDCMAASGSHDDIQSSPIRFRQIG
jgi:hypothetical protein